MLKTLINLKIKLNGMLTESRTQRVLCSSPYVFRYALALKHFSRYNIPSTPPLRTLWVQASRAFICSSSFLFFR